MSDLKDAYFYLNLGIIQRSNGGSALRSSAYNRCSSDPDFDFSHKAHEFVAGEVMLPPGAPSAYRDPVCLWTEAEAAENRKNARLGRTFAAAIPHEIPEDLRHEFCRDLFRPISDLGFAVEWCRHRVPHLLPDARDKGTDNDHVHGLVSVRTVTPEGFSKLKDRVFKEYMHRDEGREVRRDFAQRMNAFMERHRIAARVMSTPQNEGKAPIPYFDKPMVRAIQRWQEQVAIAEAEGRPAPAPSMEISQLLEQRREAQRLNGTR
jgi:hypothetical protein